jgi:tRNA pseudouridine55 synthase
LSNFVIENSRKPAEGFQITQLPKLPNPLMNGVIIIDKPAGWTSHDVVNRMRRILQERSVGHLGTLDPLATGVLPLVTGSLTRLAQFYTTSEKTYEGVIRFGFATDTYDADGEPVESHVGTAALGCPEGRRPDLSLETLQQLAARFQGLIEQVPPPFSAKKIHGVPAYKLARKHKEVILKPVQVEIKEFVILAVEGDRAQFRARVASGTYMRSVAHEMGQLLGSGAHLESLRRTAVAEFEIAQAHTLEEIEGQIKECHSDPTTNCHSDRSFALPGRAKRSGGTCCFCPRKQSTPSSSTPANSCPNFPPSPPMSPPPPASAADAPSTFPSSPAPARSKSSKAKGN